MAAMVRKIPEQMNKFMVLVKNGPKEYTERIRSTEKGNEHARTFMANSKSNILPFSATPDLLSNSLTDAICANGQKLQALCGKTTINNVIATSCTGNNTRRMLLSRNAIPDRKNKKDKIIFAC